MKKLFIFAASSLLMLASCSESNDFVNTVAQDSPIAFSAYNGNGTRAGTAGDINSETLQSTGFGVFAYNTGVDDYGAENHSTMATTGEAPNETPKWIPNFMWNQRVTYSTESSAWTYTPLKYWPNGVDTEGATQTAANVQQLSFFAYAPYVASTSGSEVSGIKALSQKNVPGDPKVTYALSGSGNDVDLLWGTTSTTNTNGATVSGGAQAGVTSDKYPGINVNENLTKMNTSGKVSFNFKHALAKINDVQVKIAPDVDMETDDDNRPLTKITVSNITITSINFTDHDKDEGEGKKSTKGGVFNLATGEWTLDDSDAEQSSTEYITTGGSGTNVLNPTIVDPTTVSASTIFGVSPASGITGVTTNYVTAYDNSRTRRPLMLMPGTKPEFTITITYIVRTEDANLSEGYSQTTQTITKKVQFGSAVELNKQYTLNLILGLTSIKVEATVSEWTNGSATEITLPVNVAPAP